MQKATEAPVSAGEEIRRVLTRAADAMHRATVCGSIPDSVRCELENAASEARIAAATHAINPWVRDIVDMRLAFGQPVPVRFGQGVMLLEPDDDELLLAEFKRVREEFRELRDAVFMTAATIKRGEMDDDHEIECAAEILSEAVDLIVTTISLCVFLGLPIAAAWDAIWKANMAKAGGPKRDDGKQLKPPGWQPADILAVVRNSLRNGALSS